MTEEVYVSGKTKWFRHDRAEVPKNSQSNGPAVPRWSHIMYPDTKSIEIIRDLQAEGMKNVLQKDEEGFNIRWSRPTFMRRGGQDLNLSPPTVVLADGVTPLQGLVGNGSDVTTKLEVYRHRIPNTNPTKYAKAARWKSSRIDNLIPYDPPKDFTPAEGKAVAGLAEQPKPSNFF